MDIEYDEPVPTALAKRIVAAGTWTVVSFGAQRVLQLASNLLLTRLLFPEAFGLMALANVVLIGLAMFSDIGIKPVIVQHERGADPSFLNTAWTIQIIRGAALWAGACALAYPASRLYGQPVLFPLLSVLGVTAFINGFSTTALATSERSLLIGRLTASQLLGQIATLTLTAFLAWRFRSVWSLAGGSIAGALIALIAGYVMLPGHQHKLHFERTALSAISSFGRWIFFGTLVTFVAGQGIRAIQGILVPVSVLGVIAIAQTLAWMPGDLGSQLMTMVGFPALAEARRDGPAAFRRLLREMRMKVLLITIPAFIALALLSHPLITLLYDQRYHEAAPYLAIASLSSAVTVLPLGYQNAVMAMGDTRLHFQIQSVAMICRVAGLLAGFHIDDVIGMLLGIAVGTCVSYLFVAQIARRRGFFSGGLDGATLAVLGAAAAATWALYV